MRLSALLAPTLREVPSEAETISHKLMLRAGLIRKLASGIYTYLPLGWRVLHNVEKIVREEMNAAGAQEVLLPALHPAELWKETGRWGIYGKELMRIKDRHDREFCLGPTHEEVITDLVRQTVKSYRELPINLYQIQVKFRDEIRPRFGVMRSREFIMKDSYSFDRDEAGLEKSYQLMRKTYQRIFDRCGFDYVIVDADPGAIGGGASEEFMVLADSGEDEIAVCDGCGIRASRTVASVAAPRQGEFDHNKLPPIETVKTPAMKTVDEVAKFLKSKPSQLIKTLIYEADGKVVAGLVRGDHELNEVKLQRALGAQSIEMAKPATIQKVTGAPVGFSGPVGLKGIEIIADPFVLDIADGITGANAPDAHLIHVVHDRDYKPNRIVDLKLADAGDTCGTCKTGKLSLKHGIEVGHIFKLGTRYSASMKAEYVEEDGSSKPFIMGCYGIGVSRIVAAIIEQKNDKDGIIWPAGVAPFGAIVIPVNSDDPEQLKAGESLYETLIGAGIEAVLDDRSERAGVKFKDADLMGFPVQVVIGPKTLPKGEVEIKLRDGGERKVVPERELLACVRGGLSARSPVGKI